MGRSWPACWLSIFRKRFAPDAIINSLVAGIALFYHTIIDKLGALINRRQELGGIINLRVQLVDLIFLAVGLLSQVLEPLLMLPIAYRPYHEGRQAS